MDKPDILHHWSGGTDSTRALFELLERYPNKNIVPIVYVICNTESPTLPACVYDRLFIHRLREKEVFAPIKDKIIFEDFSKVNYYYEQYHDLMRRPLEEGGPRWACWICKNLMSVLTLKKALELDCRVISTGNRSVRGQKTISPDGEHRPMRVPFPQKARVQSIIIRNVARFGVLYWNIYNDPEYRDRYRDKKVIYDELESYGIMGKGIDLSDWRPKDCVEKFMKGGYIDRPFPLIHETPPRVSDELYDKRHEVLEEILLDMIDQEIISKGLGDPLC